MQNRVPNYIVPVTLDCVGEKTASRWTGTFYTKCAITHDDRFKIERSFSELMPQNPSREMDEELKLRAETLAQLSVRILQGPPWWDASRGGRDLIDSEPLYSLLNLCHDASSKWDEELEKRATKGDTDVPDESQNS